MQIKYNFKLKAVIDYEHYQDEIVDLRELNGYSNIFDSDELESLDSINSEILKTQNKIEELETNFDNNKITLNIKKLKDIIDSETINIRNSKKIDNTEEDILNDILKINDYDKRLISDIVTNVENYIKDEEVEIIINIKQDMKKIIELEELNSNDGVDLSKDIKKYKDNILDNISDLKQMFKDVVSYKSKNNKFLDIDKLIIPIFDNTNIIIEDSSYSRVSTLNQYINTLNPQLQSIIRNILASNKDTLINYINEVKENKEELIRLNNLISNTKEQYIEDFKNLYKQNIETIQNEVIEFFEVEKTTFRNKIEPNRENDGFIDINYDESFEPIFDIDPFTDKYFFNKNIFDTPLFIVDGEAHKYTFISENPNIKVRADIYEYSAYKLSTLISRVLGVSLGEKKAIMKLQEYRSSSESRFHKRRVADAKKRTKILNKKLNDIFTSPKYKGFFEVLKKEKIREESKKTLNKIKDNINKASENVKNFISKWF